MATPDPLNLIRDSVQANKEPIPIIGDAAPSSDVEAAPITQATHLYFPLQPSVSPISLDTPTRVFVDDRNTSLRDILVTFQYRDINWTEYSQLVNKLNEELQKPGTVGGSIYKLNFGDKVEVSSWLGGGDPGDFLQPLEGEAAKVERGADGARIDGATKDRGITEDWGERRLSDRNIILRGIKPTDFSHVRKHASTYLTSIKASSANNASRPGATGSGGNALVSGRQKQSRRVNPIILLSPSASSLLRMSNIKSFLDGGQYVPPDEGSSTAADRLHMARLMPSLDRNTAQRFILLDSPDRFKPDDWNHVVAVFTTGQTWQFKAYKWPQPADLFSHCLGIYVGWQGETVPPAVRGWGRGVISVGVDKYTGSQGGAGRWRDREVVEGIWLAIEESMRTKGWGREGPMR